MKTIITYYISSGAKNAQYTLWQKRDYNYEPGETGRNWSRRNRDNYICNLGNDKNRALNKARKIYNGDRHIYKADPKIVVVDNLETGFQLNAYGESPKTVWDRNSLYKIENDGIMPFGKHEGLKIDELPDDYVMYWAEMEEKQDATKSSIAIINACKKLAKLRKLYEKRDAERAERARIEALKPTSEWVGKLHDRQFFYITLEFIKGFDTMYGRSYVYKGLDEAGNIIVYFGTADLGTVGDQVKFSGKIKTHDKYQEKKQTVVTRPTQIEIKEKEEELILS